MQDKKFLRVERIADVIHKELAYVVQLCHDHRLDNLTITNVVLSRDLSIAKIYFTNLNATINVKNYDIDQAKINNILHALKNANSFIRSKLAARVSLRKVPELKFFYDQNTIQGNKIENILNNINFPSNND